MSERGAFLEIVLSYLVKLLKSDCTSYTGALRIVHV